MSTIATTPAPQISRTPLLVGIAAVGVIAVTAVVVPRLASTVGSSATTGTAASSAVITQHDLVEHRADISSSVEGARASAAMERTLTQQGKLRASRIAATTAGLTGVRVGESTVSQQVGGLAPTFGYTPTGSPQMVYNGRGLVAVGAAAPAVAASTVRQQVGGQAPTFGYTPAGHTVWNDSFVPPYDDPEWMPVIKRHYAGSFTTPATHEFH